MAVSTHGNRSAAPPIEKCGRARGALTSHDARRAATTDVDSGCRTWRGGWSGAWGPSREGRRQGMAGGWVEVEVEGWSPRFRFGPVCVSVKKFASARARAPPPQVYSTGVRTENNFKCYSEKHSNSEIQLISTVILKSTQILKFSFKAYGVFCVWPALSPRENFNYWMLMRFCAFERES